eukprot:3941878-Rhodomonas_salina.1
MAMVFNLMARGGGDKSPRNVMDKSTFPSQCNAVIAPVPRQTTMWLFAPTNAHSSTEKTILVPLAAALAPQTTFLHLTQPTFPRKEYLQQPANPLHVDARVTSALSLPYPPHRGPLALSHKYRRWEGGVLLYDDRTSRHIRHQRSQHTATQIRLVLVPCHHSARGVGKLMAERSAERAVSGVHRAVDGTDPVTPRVFRRHSLGQAFHYAVVARKNRCRVRQVIRVLVALLRHA